MRDLTGTRIGKYRIDARIGDGGMGEVYRARDTVLDHDVAIKRPLPGKRDDPRFHLNVLREARKTCKVKDEHVARVIEVIEHDDQMLIVMDFIEGQKLSDMLAHGAIDKARLTSYARQIAGALEAIHEAGLIHRDLKPANIMVTPRGRIKVLDFGLVLTDGQAKIGPLDSTASESSDLFPGAGTLHYMSPEQLKRLPLDARSDLFSLGVVLYEALTGEHPYRRSSPAETTSAILNDPPGAARGSSVPTRTSALGRVTMRLLEKDPARRYASATELKGALRSVADGSSATPTWLLRPGGLALAALLIVIGVVAGAWLIREARAPQDPTAPATTTPARMPAGRPTLAILPLDNETGQDDDPTPMIRGLIEAFLVGTDETRPIEQRRVDEVHAWALEQPSDARFDGVTRGLNAAWILDGQVYRESGLVARLDLRRAADGSRQSLVVQAPSAIRLARDAAQRIRGIISGGEVKAIERSPASQSEAAQALYETARRASRELDYSRAVELLKRALALDPQFVSAQVLLPDVLNAMGNQRDARTEADRAWLLVQARGFPEDSRVRLLAEGVYARMRPEADHEQAARPYERLLDRHPDDVEATRLLAGVYDPDRLNRPEDALGLLDRALEYDSQDATLHLDRARLLVKMERLDEADVSIDRAQEILSSFGVRGGMGDVETVRGFRYFRVDRSRARKAYAAALAAYDEDGLELRMLGPRYVLQGIDVLDGKLDQAIVTLEEIVHDARQAGHLETMTKAQSALGSAYYKAIDLDRADSMLAQAVANARDLSRLDLEHSALIARAGVLIATYRMGEARRVIERSLAIADRLGQPVRRAHSLLKLALWHRSQAEPDRVELALQPILSTETVDAGVASLRPSAYQALVLTRLDAGRYAAALEAADLAVAEAERSGHARDLGFSLCLRARVLAESGELAGARADLAVARQQERVAEKTRSWEKREREALWALHAAEGDWTGALAVVDPVAGNPDHAQMFVHEARALHELGRDDEARVALEHLRALFDTIPAYLAREVDRISAQVR